MTEDQYNANIKLTPYDPLMAKTALRFFPRWILPNHITVVRFVTSPIVFWLLWQGYYVAGLIAFLVVAFTDAIDGSMARTRRQITIWGITYDGVADKFLIGGVVLILVIKHLGFWLTGFILGLELATVIGALYYKSKGIIHPANWWGKIKMNLQVLATVFLLVDVIGADAVFGEISYWVFISSLIFGVLSIALHAKVNHNVRISV